MGHMFYDAGVPAALRVHMVDKMWGPRYKLQVLPRIRAQNTKIVFIQELRSYYFKVFGNAC